MATGGVLGNFIKLGYSSSSPVSWTAITNILSIDKFFELMTPDIDTTVSGVSIRTSMPGIPEPPEVEFTLLADVDQATSPDQEFLRLRLMDGVAFWLRVERPAQRAHTTYRAEEFQAYVKGFAPSAPVDDKQTVKVTLRYSGNYAIYNAAATAIT